MANNKKEYGMGAARGIYNIYRTNARKRDLRWNLSFELFLGLTQKPCNYCNSPPSNVHAPKQYYGPYIYSGIDRIDNEKGYDKENIVPCCMACNKAKGTLTYDEFMLWLDQVTQFRLISKILEMLNA